MLGITTARPTLNTRDPPHTSSAPQDREFHGGGVPPLEFPVWGCLFAWEVSPMTGVSPISSISSKNSEKSRASRGVRLGAAVGSASGCI